MNQWRWRPSDWLYHAEGGKHAIFRHIKSPTFDRHAAGDHFVGRVLRVSKRDLAFAYTAFDDASTDDAAAAAAVSCLDKPNEVDVVETLFQQSVVQPLLGQSYLDLPQQITLPSTFCAQLYHLALSSGNIPSSRLTSWRIDDDPEMKKTISKCNNFSVGINATLLRDYTTLMGHPGKNVISVEIKPKAGYITTSPLVSPANRCKYYRTRYSLQQELMESGQIQKGWCKQNDQNGKGNPKPSSFTPSNYSPIDLFSGDLSQIQSALKDLSNNMQNNFRVFYSGTQIFGEDIMPPDEESKAILDELFPQCTDLDAKNNTRLLDLITGTVAKVLHREELLRNLLSMQLLDVIDGDGAIKVYERLVHSCDGSNSKAEALLDKAMLCVESNGVEQRSKKPLLFHENNLTATSPYDLPNCASLHILLEEIDKFQPHHPDTDVNAFHARCIQMVGQLSQEGCIYLLQNWLLSLTMCDVSFFVMSLFDR
jgi:hypothetical protein